MPISQEEKASLRRLASNVGAEDWVVVAFIECLTTCQMTLAAACFGLGEEFLPQETCACYFGTGVCKKQHVAVKN